MKRNTRKNSKFNLILIIRPKLSFKLGEFCLDAHQSHVIRFIRCHHRVDQPLFFQELVLSRMITDVRE